MAGATSRSWLVPWTPLPALRMREGTTGPVIAAVVGFLGVLGGNDGMVFLLGKALWCAMTIAVIGLATQPERGDQHGHQDGSD